MTTNTHIKNIQSSFRQFANISQFVNPLAVTVTLKQGIHTYNTITPTFVKVTPSLGNQNFRHFLNLLNRKVFGKKFSRHGQRLKVIPVLEGGPNTRLHYHFVIDRPPYLSIKTFSDHIQTCWTSTQWGHRQIDIQRVCDQGWINYISKSHGKTEFDQSFDWMNTHLS